MPRECRTQAWLWWVLSDGRGWFRTQRPLALNLDRPVKLVSRAAARGYVQTAFSKLIARSRPVSRAESPRPV